MRVRIRGPSGQSVVNLDAAATVESLKKVIATETSLTCFEIRYGYPPKTLPLDNYPADTTLSSLEVKLSGEQLIISKRDSVSDQGPERRPQQTTVAQENKAHSLNANLSSESHSATRENLKGQSSTFATNSGFSFGSLGTAPPKPSPLRTSGSETSSTVPPLSLSRKDNSKLMSDPPEIFLPEQGGTLVLRIMPDDNSCLFRAIASAVMPGMDAMNELRSLIAQAIQANPRKYSKVVLDNKEPDDYCRWIQTEDAWGGQIELDILSKQFDLEICSIDVQRLRVDKYNEGMPTRCILVYSGIHYDTIALSPFEMPPEEDIKIFNSTEDSMLTQAVVLCQKLQEQHYFTDTAAFQIKCNDCGTTCVGEMGAVEHASKTGHYNFGEAN